MSRARPPVCVEFFGLPGSGKTTVARALHRRLREVNPGAVYGPGMTLDDKPGLPRTAGRALLIARGLPGRALDRQALRAIAAVRQQSRRDKAKAMFNYLTVAALHRILSSRECGAVIDQGVLQAIWSASLCAAEPFSPERWRFLLLAEARSAKHYVFVETPVLLCRERLSSRPGKHSRMQSPDLLGDAERWEASALVCTLLVDGLISCLEGQGSRARMMIVDGTRDPGELAEGILARILKAGVMGVDAMAHASACDVARRPSTGGASFCTRGP